MANFAIAAESPALKRPEGIQIQTMLNGIDYHQYVTKGTKINISFFINSQNEILVVATNNQALDNVIKTTLNYRKIAVEKLEYNKVYTMPVLIQ
jgi:DNA-binding transcriptional MocR family regulator